jgi:hypothetical protein
LRRIVGSGTDRLPLALVRVSLINKAQLGHGLTMLGKTGSDPEGNKADHILAVPTATTDLIHHSPSESDSKGGREVYMVANGEELPDKMIKEIQ